MVVKKWMQDKRSLFVAVAHASQAVVSTSWMLEPPEDVECIWSGITLIPLEVHWTVESVAQPKRNSQVLWLCFAKTSWNKKNPHFRKLHSNVILIQNLSWGTVIWSILKFSVAENCTLHRDYSLLTPADLECRMNVKWTKAQLVPRLCSAELQTSSCCGKVAGLFGHQTTPMLWISTPEHVSLVQIPLRRLCSGDDPGFSLDTNPAFPSAVLEVIPMAGQAGQSLIGGGTALLTQECAVILNWDLRQSWTKSLILTSRWRQCPTTGTDPFFFFGGCLTRQGSLVPLGALVQNCMLLKRILALPRNLGFWSGGLSSTTAGLTLVGPKLQFLLSFSYFLQNSKRSSCFACHESWLCCQEMLFLRLCPCLFPLVVLIRVMNYLFLPVVFLIGWKYLVFSVASKTSCASQREWRYLHSLCLASHKLWHET